MHFNSRLWLSLSEALSIHKKYQIFYRYDSKSAEQDLPTFVQFAVDVLGKFL